MRATEIIQNAKTLKVEYRWENEEFLDDLRRQGDQQADECFKKILTKEDYSKWLNTLKVNDDRLGEEAPPPLRTIVDGGVLSNFPINMLTSDEPSVRAVMGSTNPQRENVLGMLIDETREVENAPPPPEEDENDEEGVAGNIKKLRTVRRVTGLLNTLQEAHDKQLIAANEELICRLPAKTYGTMEFDMTDDRKAALVKAGEEIMKKHLATRTYTV